MRVQADADIDEGVTARNNSQPDTVIDMDLPHGLRHAVNSEALVTPVQIAPAPSRATGNLTPELRLEQD